MPTPHDDNDPSAEELEQAEDAGQAAFASSFEDQGNKPPERAAKEPTDEPAEEPAESKSKTKGAKKEDEPAKPVDPYAGLPKEVRDQLALASTVPQLKHQLDSLNGRLVQLQKERADDARKAAAAKEPEKPAVAEKRERVRGELSEVAEAIDEVEARIDEKLKKAGVGDKPASDDKPAPDAGAAWQATRARLDAVDPKWSDKLNSGDFKLWLTQQEPKYAENVLATDDPALITHALAKFDVHTDAVKSEAQRKAKEKADLEASRKERVDAAARTRSGNGRRADAPIDNDAEAAFEEAFKGS